MSVTFNPSFTQNIQPKPQKTISTNAETVKTTKNEDEFLPAKKQDKKSTLDKAKGVITGIKKFGIMASAMTGGTLKGILYGAMSGAAVLTANSLYRGFKFGVKNAGFKPNMIGKAAAVAVGATTLVGTLVKAKLKANSKTAEVDHRWRTGHRDK